MPHRHVAEMTADRHVAEIVRQSRMPSVTRPGLVRPKRVETNCVSAKLWVWAADGKYDFECAAVLTGHSQDVKSVVFHPHKELAVSTSYDDTVKVWVEDDEDWYCCDTATGHSSTVWSAAFNAEGDRLVSCSDDLQLRLWRLVEDSAGGQADPKLVPVGADGAGVSGSHTRTIYSVDWSHSHNRKRARAS